jgi:hypothetical protein
MSFKPGLPVSDTNPYPVAAGPTDAVQLALNVASLAPNGVFPATGWVAVPGAGAVFFWSVIMTGAGPLALEFLGPDGSTPMQATTINATGTKEIGIAAGAQVRLKNIGGVAITNLSASLG